VKVVSTGKAAFPFGQGYGDARDKCGQESGQSALPAMYVNRKSLDFIGGAERDRTVDLLNKTQSL